MEEKVMFSFLPLTIKIKEKGISPLIELRNRLDKDKDNYATYYNIIWYLIYRLIAADNNSIDKEYGFTKEDYKVFKSTYSKVKIDKENFILDSVLTCLKTPNSKILEELNRFSEIVDWYPEGIRTKDEETNKYIYQKEEIKMSDCFSLSVRIMNKMYQFIHNYSTTVTKKFQTPKDVKLTLEKYISDSFYQNMYLTYFDDEFKYLKDFPMFKSIYDNVRKQALNLLLYKIKTYYTFDEIEYGFGDNIYHRNELAYILEKKDKDAARRNKNRR